MADESGDRARVIGNRRVGFAVALAGFAVDQVAKLIVTYPLQLSHRKTLEILPFFKLTWLENRGVSMGLLNAESQLGRWGLVVLTAAIAIFVTLWLWREKRRDDAFALALVLGGALGNILDRL